MNLLLIVVVAIGAVSGKSFLTKKSEDVDDQLLEFAADLVFDVLEVDAKDRKLYMPYMIEIISGCVEKDVGCVTSKIQEATKEPLNKDVVAIIDGIDEAIRDVEANCRDEHDILGCAEKRGDDFCEDNFDDEEQKMCEEEVDKVVTKAKQFFDERRSYKLRSLFGKYQFTRKSWLRK